MGAANDLRARVDDAWAAFRDAVELRGLGVTTSAGWTVKEMLAHIAFWMETVPPFFNGMWRGDPSAFSVTFPSGFAPPDDAPWPDADTHNAREAAWAREQPDHVVVARAERAFDQLRSFLVSVTDEEAQERAEYFRDLDGHLNAHRLQELQPVSP